MIRRLVLALALLLILPGARGTALAKTYRADRFDVKATLQLDRSLHVDEVVVFRFEGGTFTSVWRELPTRRSDGVVEIVARMDGRVLPEGTGTGAVEIRRGSRVRVTWHFAPLSGVHEFGLEYRLLGVAAASGGTDDISWIALPEKHGYGIDQATVAFGLPDSAALQRTLRVLPAAAEVAITPGLLKVTARDVGRDESIRLDAQVASGTLSAVPPRWQALDVDRRRRGPWLLVVAGTILVTGIGWLLVWLSPFSRPELAAAVQTRPAGPPDPRRPAPVAARLAGRRGRLGEVVATIVELASTGVLRIEQRSRARVLGRGFDVHLVREPSHPEPHEAALVDLLFGSASGRSGPVSWRRVQEQVKNRGGRFVRALDETMRRAGLVDADRAAARRTLVRVALLAVVSAALSLVGAGLTLPLFGAWAFVVPVAAGLLAMILGIAAGRFSVLSRQGEREARAWRAFFAGFKDKDRVQAVGADAFRDWLPWIVAAGAAAPVANRAAAAGVPLPAWFRPAGTDADGANAAFVSLVATGASGDAHVVDGSGAGAAGAGAAAGGGSSGAA